MDDVERHDEPLPGMHGCAETILDRDVETTGRKEPVEQVLERYPVDIDQREGRDHFDACQEECRFLLRVREPPFDLTSGDTDLVNDGPIFDDQWVVRLTAQDI